MCVFVYAGIFVRIPARRREANLRAVLFHIPAACDDKHTGVRTAGRIRIPRVVHQFHTVTQCKFNLVQSIFFEELLIQCCCLRGMNFKIAPIRL